MNGAALSAGFLIASGILGFFQLGSYHDDMPVRVAMHFAANGQPDGWLNREGWLWLNAGLYGINTLFFLVLAWLLNYLPSRWFSLPNRDYWLAPARRRASLDMLSSWLHVVGIANNVLFLNLVDLIYQVNQRRPPYLEGSPMGLSLLGLLAFIGLWIGALIFRLKKLS